MSSQWEDAATRIIHILSSKDKLEVNDVRDTLIAKESHQLARTFDINTRSAFVSSTTTCHNCGGRGHLA
jgi:hypothetical protein